MKSNLLRFSIATLLCLQFANSASAQTIGSKMATFLNGSLGKKIGGGECSHMATEALRVSAGEFVASDLGTDSPSAGDYVWGTLVTVISYNNKTWTDSNPKSACLVGDVIQYNGAAFGTVTAAHHTSVVAAVNSSGRPTSIYQQNFNNVRTVQQATIDTTKMTAGWIRIYRPKAVTIRTNEWKVTVCNNTTSPQTYSMNAGVVDLGSTSLTAANTAGSYTVIRVDTSGTIPDLLLVDGKSFFLQNGKAYQIPAPSPSTAPVAFNQLTP